ncbi:MAG TPA: HEAT repeat domain-containing protein [Dehalococcoidia bacterium]|nr:HEAT repeat domain-containing protein [Dehalococcoidia bacterium]
MGLEGYLEELADSGRPLRVSKLANLTQLTPDERAEFEQAWPGLDADRRVQILNQLNDLAEDNPELNFDAVYLASLQDRDPRVRTAALDGLWEYEERELIPILVGLLRGDEDAEVRAAAALSLGRFVVLGEFGSLRPSDVTVVEDALTESINDLGEIEDVRARALESIGARSEPWVRDLITDAYSGESHRMQVSAIHAMGRSCDEEWLPEVIQQLQNEDPEIRYEAATAAGMIGDESTVPHLAFLVHDEDTEVQEVAIEALAEIGGPEARGILTRALTSGDPLAQDAARDALASMELAGAVEDEDSDDF